MKILYIAPYPPNKGGLETYTLKTVSELQKLGEQVWVLTAKTNNIGFNYHTIRLLSLNPIDVYRIYKKIIKLKIEIIHLQYNIPAFGFLIIPIIVLLIVIGRFTNIKVFATFHEVKRETDMLGFFASVYYRIISNLFKSVYVHTVEAKSILVTHCKIKPELIKVIPHPVFYFNKNSINNCDIKNLNINKNNYIILYFGYIHVDKGIEYLIKAAKQLFKKKPNLIHKTSVIIAGEVRPRHGLFKLFEYRDWRYKEKLIQLVNLYQLQNKIKFLNYIEENQIYPLLSQAKVIVLPYLNSEHSGVLHQAISIPKPVIASNIGGLKETLRNTGVLVKPRDYNEIFSNLVRLIEDNNLYKNIKSKYRKLAKTLSIDKINKKLIADYKYFL